MKTKKQRKPRIDTLDVDMTDVSEPKARPKTRRAKKASPKPLKTFDKVSKFKEDQHLNIETQNIADEVEPDAEKAAPPSSTSKKRRRRPAAEIDRKFKCSVADCPKAYGSEGSLIHHQRLKHPELAEVEAQEKKETQVGTFLLPLHNAPRNVTIRPATPLVTFASDPNMLLSNQNTNDIGEFPSPTDIVPPSAKAPRRNMRSRSNSEPVTVIDEVIAPMVPLPIPTLSSIKSHARTPRKSHRAATPHPKKTVTPTRRTKLRSKSESLPEMASFQPLEELKMPANHRSNSVASAHESILPISNNDSGGLGSFEWPPTSISASGHHSTSLSSDDQAIDSDILSVLANCDAEDIGDPTVLDFGGGPPSTSSFQSNTSFGESEDTEMLPVGMECFKIAENATLSTEPFVMKEPEAELGLNAFATLGDEWANALHLSNHLEKMSMAQGDTPPHSLESTLSGVPTREGSIGRLRSASDPIHVAAPMHPGLHHFSSMPLEPFLTKSELAVNQMNLSSGENELVGQQLQRNVNMQQWFGSSSLIEPAEVEDSSMQPMFLLSSEPGAATVGNPQPSSEALDKLLQNDDTLEWKATNEFEGDAVVGYALSDAGDAVDNALIQSYR